MTTVETPKDPSAVTGTTPQPGRSWRATLTSTEIDTRLFGLGCALIAIWIAFHILSGGDFLTARNLWNLSVQSTSIAIMATGMVLIIVSRNIDLSVGSLLGFLGYTMALVQTDGILSFFGINVNADGLQGKAIVWVVALAFGLLLGASSAACRASSWPTGGCPPSSSPSAGSSSGEAPSSASGASRARRSLHSIRRSSCSAAGRRARSASGGAGCSPCSRARDRAQPRARPPAAPALRPRRPAGLGRDRAGRPRVRGRHHRRRAGRQPLPVADHGQGDGRRLPGRDPDRGHAADELPRPAPALRPLRVRLRRQPRGGRARRHQHPPHRHADVRPHGRPMRRRVPPSRRPGSTPR